MMPQTMNKVHPGVHQRWEHAGCIDVVAILDEFPGQPLHNAFDAAFARTIGNRPAGRTISQHRTYRHDVTAILLNHILEEDPYRLWNIPNDIFSMLQR